jgi:hypothetical protein
VVQHSPNQSAAESPDHTLAAQGFSASLEAVLFPVRCSVEHALRHPSGGPGCVVVGCRLAACPNSNGRDRESSVIDVTPETGGDKPVRAASGSTQRYNVNHQRGPLANCWSHSYSRRRIVLRPADSCASPCSCQAPRVEIARALIRQEYHCATRALRHLPPCW